MVNILPLPPPAACATNFYKGADGTCKACINGATSDGTTTTCSCSGAGAAYNTTSAYDPLEGCTCAGGYVKDTTTKLCDSCDANYYTNGTRCQACIGGGTTTRGNRQTTCFCPNTNQGVNQPGWTNDE